MDGGLPGGGGGWQGREFEQRAGGLRAVEAAVSDDRSLVCAPGAAVVRVQVLDQLGASAPERDGPGFGVAVGVAGVVDDVAERGAGLGHAQQDGGQHAGGSRAQEQTVIRRASSGAGGPFSSRTMTAIDRYQP